MFNRFKNWITGLYIPEAQISNDKRDYFIDNLKAFLIVLVILGHVITSLKRVPEMTYLYYFIYTFHMPCFIFTSGYHAKNIIKNGRFNANRYFSSLWTYIFFCTAIRVISFIFNNKAGIDYFHVNSAPWYMLALSTWYILTPLLLSMKKRTTIIITILIGLFAGYSENIGSYLSLSKTLVFLPFFTLGLLTDKEQLNKFLSKKLRIPALIILILTFAAFLCFGKKFAVISSLTFGGSPYSSVIKELAPYGFIIRFCLYILAVILSASLMLVTMRRKMWFSYVGKYSLSVYILHILVRNILKYTGFFTAVKKLPGKYMLFSIPICILAALILANPIFGNIINAISNPVKFIKKKKISNKSAN